MERAFPERYDAPGGDVLYYRGMTRKLWVATHVLAGMLGHPACFPTELKLNVVLAWQYADRLLELEEEAENMAEKEA